MRPVIAIIRSPQLVKLPPSLLLARQAVITASIYLDDLLVLINTQQNGAQVVAAVVDLYEKLGLKIKQSKSVLAPQQHLEHLGFLVDCTNHVITLPQRKLLHIQSLCTDLLGHLQKQRRWVNKRKFARVVGYLQSCTYALPFGRFHLAHMYRAFSTTIGWEGNVKVSHRTLTDLT